MRKYRSDYCGDGCNRLPLPRRLAECKQKLSMNAHNYDDLSFKLLSLTIIAGVLAAFIDTGAKPAPANPVVLPMIQSVAPAPVALAAKPDSGPLGPTVATPTTSKHRDRGHRHEVEKS